MADGATIGSGVLSGTGIGTSQATFTTSALLSGARSITAVYSGDPLVYNPSTSSAYAQNVNVASTTTTVHTDLNPLGLGQLVTLSADVSGCAVTPVGTVTFKNGATVLGSGTLDASGHAVFTTNALLTGLLPITAVFPGDSNCGGSTSTALNLTVNLGLASAGVASSQNPGTYNQSVTFTATVTGIVLLTPSGTVTFKDNTKRARHRHAQRLGASRHFPPARSRSAAIRLRWSITADTLYGTATSSTLTQTVNKAATTSAVVSSVNPASYGGSTTFTATVSSTAGTPTGTVTFHDGATVLGAGTLDGSGQTTFLTSALSVGNHTITAIYGGDGNFITSTSPVLTQSIGMNASATALVSSANPSAYNQSVTFTATVTGSGGTPDGTVTFKDGATSLGTGALDGAGVATLTTSALAPGNHSVTAAYGGNTNFSASTSAPLTQSVGIGISTATLIASPNPSALGQSISFTATVTGAGATPTGTVTFKDGGSVIGTAPLNGSGQAALSYGALGAGAHTITAEYGGDAVYGASTSAPFSQTVSQGSSTTALTASANPSAFGQSVTFTASVSGTGATATGTVTFKDGATPLGTGTLNGSGQATFATAALSVGGHAITAVYGGDSNFTTSTSPTLTQNVNTTTSTITLASSANPSATGQSVTFIATVSGSGGTPSGTVTFKDGATPLGAGTLSNGQASYTTSALTAGSHSITAVYGGDGNYNPSTSSALTQNVNANASTTTMISSSNPAAFGQPVVYTATVFGGAGTPTGIVTFKDGGTTLGTASVNGAGQAIFTAAALAGGSHTITALYGGDTSYGSSISAPLTQTINPGAPGVTLTPSVNPSASGQPVTFTAVVSGIGGIPTGLVTFKDGPATLGAGTLDGSGHATYTANALSTGSHSMRALLRGRQQLCRGFFSIVTQNVNAFTSTATLTSSANPSIAGQSVTFTTTVSGSGGTPTGTVTFKDGTTTLASRSLDGAGSANFATSALAVGGHPITITYSGDGNYAATTSPALMQSVNTSATTTSLISSLNPSAPGQTVTFTASIGGTGGMPTGTVTFKDGGTVLATHTLTGSGIATFATSALGLGSHTITRALQRRCAILPPARRRRSIRRSASRSNSLRLRAFQVLATKMAAQTSGQATAGTIESAVAEGFADDGEIIRPSELGLRMNFSADPRETIRTDELHTGAFSDILKKEDATGSIPQRAPGAPLHEGVAGLGGSAQHRLACQPATGRHQRRAAQHAGRHHLQGHAGFPCRYRRRSRNIQLHIAIDERAIVWHRRRPWRLYRLALAAGIRIEASLSRTSIDYSASSGSAAASFPGARWLFTAGITGTDNMQRIELEPSLRVYYLTETEKGYTDSLGTAQTDRTFSAGPRQRRRQGDLSVAVGYRGPRSRPMSDFTPTTISPRTTPRRRLQPPSASTMKC